MQAVHSAFPSDTSSMVSILPCCWVWTCKRVLYSATHNSSQVKLGWCGMCTAGNRCSTGRCCHVLVLNSPVASLPHVTHHTATHAFETKIDLMTAIKRATSACQACLWSHTHAHYVPVIADAAMFTCVCRTPAYQGGLSRQTSGSAPLGCGR